jgi:hypothetical protein
MYTYIQYIYTYTIHTHTHTHTQSHTHNHTHTLSLSANMLPFGCRAAAHIKHQREGEKGRVGDTLQGSCRPINKSTIAILTAARGRERKMSRRGEGGGAYKEKSRCLSHLAMRSLVLRGCHWKVSGLVCIYLSFTYLFSFSDALVGAERVPLKSQWPRILPVDSHYIKDYWILFFPPEID